MAFPPVLPGDLVRHADGVRRLATHLVGTGDVAEDVAQEALLTGLHAGPRPGFSLASWLRGVTRNKAREARRAARRRERHERRAAPSAAASAADAAARAEESRILATALAALPEAYRTALWLRFFDDLPPREIGARLGIPAETARTRVKRGLDALREELDRRHPKGRREWVRALAPLAGSSASVPWMLGGAMGTKVTLSAIGAAALLAGWLLATREEAERPAPAPVSRDEPASAAPVLRGASPTGDAEPDAAEPEASAVAAGAELVLELRAPRLEGRPSEVAVSVGRPGARPWRWSFAPNGPVHAVAPGPTLERIPSADPAAYETVRVRGLPTGEAWLSASISDAAIRAAAVPRLVRLARGSNPATLELVPAADFATLSFEVSDGEDRVDGAAIRVDLAGVTSWATVRTDSMGLARVAVPAPSEVRASLESFSGKEVVDVPPDQTVTVAPRETRSVVFAIRGTVPVEFEAVTPNGAHAIGAQGQSGVWRLGPGRPVHLGFVHRSGGGGARTRLPPGAYGVLFTAGGDFAPTWHRFEVEPDRPTTARGVLSAAGRRARIRVSNPDGSTTGLGGRSVGFGRVGIDDPSLMAYTTASLDTEGRVTTQPLPDGEYDLTVWHLGLVRRVSVGPGSTEFRLRLPEPLEPSKTGVVEGRYLVSGEGRALPDQLVAQARPLGSDWAFRANSQVGGYRLSLPAGPARLFVEPTPWSAFPLRGYEAVVDVVAGETKVHDVPLESR